MRISDIFYFFISKKGKRAAEAHRKICAVYGTETVTKRTCQNWFAKFRSGKYSVQDALRPGRPSEINEDRLKALLETD